MTTIKFDTTVDEGREESGEMTDGVLRTSHENRPDFEIQDDGSVDLHLANVDRVLESWAENGEVVEQ